MRFATRAPAAAVGADAIARALGSGDDGAGGDLPALTTKGVKFREDAAAAALEAQRALDNDAGDDGSDGLPTERGGGGGGALSSRRRASGSNSLREGAALNGGNRPSSGARPSSAGSASSGNSSRSHVSNGTGISGPSAASRRRSTAQSDTSVASRRTEASGAPPPLAGRSLWLLPEDSELRLRLYDLVTSKRFDYAMFALILFNCAAMAYEYPHMPPGAVDTLVIHWLDVAFTALFGLEAVAKILAFTFRGYIASATNKVDLLIVVISVLLLALDVAQIEAVKALRVLRAAKPLRALTRSAGMRLVFRSVTMSLASMANVSLVVLLFFAIFAILGVQLFAGKFWSCNDPTVGGRESCVGTFVSPDGGEVRGGKDEAASVFILAGGGERLDGWHEFWCWAGAVFLLSTSSTCTCCLLFS